MRAEEFVGSMFRLRGMTALQRMVIEKGLCPVCHERTLETLIEGQVGTFLQCKRCLMVVLDEKEEV